MEPPRPPGPALNPAEASQKAHDSPRTSNIQRSQGRTISPVRRRSESIPSHLHDGHGAPPIMLTLAESVGHLQQSMNAPRNARGLDGTGPKPKPPSPLRRDSTEQQPEETRWRTPPREVTRLQLNFVDKLKIIDDSVKKSESISVDDRKSNINRTFSNPEKEGDVKGGSRNSPGGGIDTLRRVAARNSLERRGSGSLERRGSSPSVATFSKVIIGKNSADRLQRLTPTTYIKLISSALFPNQLVYLAILTDEQYKMVLNVFSEKLFPKLRQMNVEQFRRTYHSLRNDVARTRFKVLIDKPEFQRFSLLIDGDESLRRKLKEDIFNSKSDSEVIVLVNQKAKSILNSPILIKEILDLYKITEDPKILYNLVLFMEQYISVCASQEVMQVSSEISDLVNLAMKYQLKNEKGQEIDKESQLYASKIVANGAALQKCLGTISEEFFAQEIIDLILHRKEYAGTTFETLCEHFALAHVWFTSTSLMLKRISENLTKNNIENDKPLLQFLDTLIKIAPPDYFTEEDLELIKSNVITAETNLSESVKHLAESLKSNLEKKSEKTIGKSESDPTPLTLPGKGSKIEQKGSKIEQVVSIESLLKKKSKDSAELLAHDLKKLLGNSFRKISLNDFTRIKWMKNPDTTIGTYTTLFNQLVCFFQDQILDGKFDNKKRAKLISILIETLRISSEEDFASSMLIISILDSTSIRRLGCWNKVEDSRRSFFKTFDNWVGAGHLTIKRLMNEKGRNSINPFIIPFLAEFMTTSEVLGNICSFGGEKGITAMINESKVKCIAELLSKLRGYQQRLSLGGGLYRTELCGLIRNAKLLSDDEVWALSINIEPSKSQPDRKIIN